MNAPTDEDAWQEEARRYAQNADYWRARAAALEEDVAVLSDHGECCCNRCDDIKRRLRAPTPATDEALDPVQEEFARASRRLHAPDTEVQR